MKYKNYGPYKNDLIGKLLQFRVDYSYMKHKAPHLLTKNARRLNRLISILIFLVLCALIYFVE